MPQSPEKPKIPLSPETEPGRFDQARMGAEHAPQTSDHKELEQAITDLKKTGRPKPTPEVSAPVEQTDEALPLNPDNIGEILARGGSVDPANAEYLDPQSLTERLAGSIGKDTK